MLGHVGLQRPGPLNGLPVLGEDVADLVEILRRVAALVDHKPVFAVPPHPVEDVVAGVEPAEAGCGADHVVQGGK